MSHATAYRLVTAKKGELWSIALVRGQRCLTSSAWCEAEEGEMLRDRFVHCLEDLYNIVAAPLYTNNHSRKILSGSRLTSKGLMRQ
jgi:hypothetical protein